MRPLVLYGPPIVMMAISVLYFRLGRKEIELWIRMLFSVHGALAALLYIGALAVWGITRAHHSGALRPFLFLYIAPFASVAYALIRFPGPKAVHLLQVINLALMCWTGVVAAIAITGNWI